MSRHREQRQLRRLEYDPADFAPDDWEVATFAPFRMAFSTDLGVSQVAPVEPIDSSTDVASAIRAVRDMARRNDCAMGLQFNERLWPGLESKLVEAGLESNKREPLLACTPDTFQRVVKPGVQARFLDRVDPRGEFEAYE